MKCFYSRLSKDKRMFMAECLRGLANGDNSLMAHEKNMLLRIASMLCDVQIEVKCEISDPEYQVKSNNE